MKAADVRGWLLVTREAQDDDEMRCPACGIWSPLAAWEESEVPCDLCGSHGAVRCPACEHDEDVVGQRVPLELRTPRTGAHGAS